MTATGILPTYQRFVNGVPVPSFSRRSFRPREKYLILLVFMTFGVVCFGAFFYLPEFSRASGTVNSVYKHMQKAGPELLIPAPPHADDVSELPGGGKIIRHGDLGQQDPHRSEDRAKLQAKIEEAEEQDKMRNQKVLERPDIFVEPVVSVSAALKTNKPVENVIEENAAQKEQKIVTIPPAPSDRYPATFGGEDADPIARERRNKVKEVRYDVYQAHANFLGEPSESFRRNFNVERRGAVPHRNSLLRWIQAFRSTGISRFGDVSWRTRSPDLSI
ncbi:mannosyl-oligosaccharide alpha-1,2-mannosidase IA-like, partial [Schistocerca americana]|uniref:mannosyl-oligosaccharide alpha-1,2-mannosidase IA-like n=1 Tax=Schistocerca americana TaxID=7009 RepID=UPI001F50212F